MIRKSVPSGYDPIDGHRFSERIMFKKKIERRLGEKASCSGIPDPAARRPSALPSIVPLLVKYEYCIE
jgi:hypothetical protein